MHCPLELVPRLDRDDLSVYINYHREFLQNQLFSSLGLVRENSWNSELRDVLSPEFLKYENNYTLEHHFLRDLDRDPSQTIAEMFDLDNAIYKLAHSSSLVCGCGGTDLLPLSSLKPNTWKNFEYTTLVAVQYQGSYEKQDVLKYLDLYKLSTLFIVGRGRFSITDASLLMVLSDLSLEEEIYLPIADLKTYLSDQAIRGNFEESQKFVTQDKGVSWFEFEDAWYCSRCNSFLQIKENLVSFKSLYDRFKSSELCSNFGSRIYVFLEILNSLNLLGLSLDHQEEKLSFRKFQLLKLVSFIFKNPRRCHVFFGVLPFMREVDRVKLRELIDVSDAKVVFVDDAIFKLDTFVNKSSLKLRFPISKLRKCFYINKKFGHGPQVGQLLCLSKRSSSFLRSKVDLLSDKKNQDYMFFDEKYLAAKRHSLKGSSLGSTFGIFNLLSSLYATLPISIARGLTAKDFYQGGKGARGKNLLASNPEFSLGVSEIEFRGVAWRNVFELTVSEIQSAFSFVPKLNALTSQILRLGLGEYKLITLPSSFLNGDFLVFCILKYFLENAREGSILVLDNVMSEFRANDFIILSDYLLEMGKAEFVSVFVLEESRIIRRVLIDKALEYLGEYLG